MKKKRTQKQELQEENRHDEIVGYDRNYDPVQEWKDLQLAERHRQITAHQKK